MSTTIKNMPTGDARIEWMEDKPYSKISFLEKISKDTPEKKKWLYTFSWYIQDIYWSGNEYLDVAQKNDSWLFAPLGPGQAFHGKWIIMEISKRTSNWHLPKTADEANALDPSIVLNYAGHTYTIQLPAKIESSKWFELLDNTHDNIAKKCDALDEEKKKDPTIIKDIVIQTLQEKNYLKAHLEKSLAPINWWKQRLLQLFWFTDNRSEEKKSESVIPKAV